MINFDLDAAILFSAPLLVHINIYVPAGPHFSFHSSGINLPRKPLYRLFVSPDVCY